MAVSNDQITWNRLLMFTCLPSSHIAHVSVPFGWDKCIPHVIIFVRSLFMSSKLKAVFHYIKPVPRHRIVG